MCRLNIFIIINFLLPFCLYTFKFFFFLRFLQYFDFTSFIPLIPPAPNPTLSTEKSENGLFSRKYLFGIPDKLGGEDGNRLHRCGYMEMRSGMTLSWNARATL